MKKVYLARLFLSAILALPVQATIYSIPNTIYPGDMQMQNNSGLNPLDGPKLAPWPNASAYDWWYFDVVSVSTNASFTGTFFLNQAGFSGADDELSNMVGVWVTFPNGTAVKDYMFVDQSEKITVTTLGDGSSGDWKGTGATYTGSPDLKVYTINFYGSSMFEGSIVLNSVSPAHYPCNKAEPFSDEMVCPHVGWANAIPDANAVVDLAVSGEKLTFLGYGYHDKNWGAINFSKAVQSWYWGHGRLGPYSIVWFDTISTDGREYVSSYVTDNGNIIAGNCDSGSLRVRPFGGDDTYPPYTTSLNPNGYSISYDLGKRGIMSVNFTIELNTFTMPHYNRFVGKLEGGILGEEKFNGRALGEQFAF